MKVFRKILVVAGAATLGAFGLASASADEATNKGYNSYAGWGPPSYGYDSAPSYGYGYNSASSYGYGYNSAPAYGYGYGHRHRTYDYRYGYGYGYW